MIAYTALAWFALAGASDAFEVLTGECRLETPGSGWVFMRTAAICVQQQSRRRGDCTFTAPALALTVDSFDVRAGDFLRVNGVEYTGGDGPDGVVPRGTVEWHDNSTGSSFMLCRPRVPRFGYVVTLFVYGTLCCCSLFLFLVARYRTFIAMIIVGSPVIVVCAVVMHQYDGYILEDNGFFGSVVGQSEFFFEASSANWLMFYWELILVLPLSTAMFVRTRMKAKQRTAELERKLRVGIADGCIRLLSVPWLLAQPADYILRRRQELPDEALIAPEVALQLLGQGRVGVLSYRWLKAHHPDPDGWHMRAVRDFLRHGFSYADNMSLMWNGGEASVPRALFWDFASCHQKDADGNRTEAEKQQFSRSLSVMTYLYATPNSLVLQHKRLPADFPPDQPTYEQSGWCTMESAAAGLQTEGGGSRYELGRGWSRLYAGDRLSPAELAAIFADEERTKFVGRADRDQVAELYARLHQQVLEIDLSRRRALTWLFDGIIDCIGCPVEAWIGFFWCFIVFMILPCALMAATQPSPSVIGFGCWFVASCLFLPAVSSRRFRQFHLRLCAGSRVRPDAPAGHHAPSHPRRHTEEV
jgi:hypothetical protein